MIALIPPAFSSDVEVEQPVIRVDGLTVQVVFEGLKFPTSIAFLGPNDILALEKNEGTVRRIVDGQMVPEPLLKVNVSTVVERGMLGIAVANNVTNTEKSRYVFLYYTEPEQQKKNRAEGDSSDEKIPLASNNIYRYELIDNKLINPKHLLQLPARDEGAHNGGTLLIGPDENLYAISGSVAIDKPKSPEDTTWSQNVFDGPQADGRGGILRFTQDGQPVLEDGEEKGILGDEHPLNLYYAYGIRNGFGMDFDPVAGLLWDSENGGSNYDEINLVESGFNSGWRRTMGLGEQEKRLDTDTLVDFEGKGKYSDPEFVWKNPAGPTALKFLNSKNYGEEYENDMFVSDFHNGNIYHFELNEDRTELALEGDLEDKMADNPDEFKDLIFGEGFGGVTDLEVGPDGYLYVVSLLQGGDNCRTSITSSDKNCVAYSSGMEGKIFRIVPQESEVPTS